MPTHDAPANSPAKPGSVVILPLLPGDGGDADELLHWLSHFVLELHNSGWLDAEKIERFELQLTPGRPAQKWFTDLSSSDTTMFATLRKAFKMRWPLKRRPPLTKQHQKQCLRDLVLPELAIGELREMNRSWDYVQNLWAEEVAQLAVSMGDVGGNLIAYVLEKVPTLLRDYLDADYDSWLAFVEAVHAISPTHVQAE